MAIALSIAFVPTPFGAAEQIVIEATDQVSAGKYFMPRSKYKIVFVGAAASTSPANILANWNAIYGALISGRKIFVRARSFSGTGIPGPLIESSKVVT